jgi:hypothetical protein
MFKKYYYTPTLFTHETPVTPTTNETTAPTSSSEIDGVVIGAVDGEDEAATIPRAKR